MKHARDVSGESDALGLGLGLVEWKTRGMLVTSPMRSG